MEKIINEVELKKQQREREKAEKLKNKPKALQKEEEEKEPPKEVVLPKNYYDIQKRKLDRLMNNPDKLIELPQPRKDWKPRDAPEFVRHVMGSSAGAGSGEFHVYRGIRRRENRRQEFLAKIATKEELDIQFQEKIEENKQKSEDATAKKRAKRQRKKQKKMMAKKAKKGNESSTADQPSEEEESEEEEEEKEDPHFVIGGN